MGNSPKLGKPVIPAGDYGLGLCVQPATVSETEIELQESAVPELLERGRYAVTGMPDGSWVITRAGPLCERCSDCGCGDQGEPVPVPAIAVQAMTGQLNGSARKMLAKMLGRG